MRSDGHRWRGRAWSGACAVLIALVANSPPSQAEPNSQVRLDVLARLPDWTGVWQVEGSSATLEAQMTPEADAHDHAPYNAEWALKYAQLRSTVFSQHDPTQLDCTAGVPRLIGAPYRFIALVTPEQTLLQFSSREIRRIYTDGRVHTLPEAQHPTPWGESIGHWEAETLVFDTFAITPGRWLDPTGATLSAQARVFERMSMPDRNHMRDEVTILDPPALTKAWSFVRTYRRAPTKELSEQSCAALTEPAPAPPVPIEAGSVAPPAATAAAPIAP